MKSSVRRLTPLILGFLAFAACASTSAPTQKRQAIPAGTPAGTFECPWGPPNMRGWADSGMSHMFVEARTKVTVAGTIQQVIGDNLKLYMPHVVLVVSKSATSPTQIVIHAGPRWFFEQQGIKLQAGEQISVEGRALDAEPQTVIATSLKMGGKTLQLRDEVGRPLWIGALRQGPRTLRGGPN